MKMKAKVEKARESCQHLQAKGYILHTQPSKKTLINICGMTF